MTTPTFGSAHAVALALHALRDLVDQELHRLTIRIQGEIDEHERWNGLNALDLWERYS